MDVLVIGNGFDIEHDILIRFTDFVNSDVFSENIGSYAKFFSCEMYREFSRTTELWSDFEGYLKYVCENSKIQPTVFINKVSKTFGKWIASIDITPCARSAKIEKILNYHDISIVLSFNYTNTPEKYGFSKKTFNYNSTKNEWRKIESLINKCVFLHYFESSNRKSNYVIGNDGSPKINKSKIIENWSGLSKYNPKKLVFDTLVKSEKISGLVFYGFSFGESDKEAFEFVNSFLAENKRVTVYYKGDVIRKSSEIIYLPVQDL